MSESAFPLWRLGYWSNPFRALTTEEWSDLALLPDGVPKEVTDLPSLTQIVGEQGRGKTSALLALMRELQQRGKPVIYDYLAPGARRYTHSLSRERITLIDEAQRLAPRWLSRLLSELELMIDHHPVLIIASHTDIAARAAERGISTLSISVMDHSPAFIHELIERRLNYFERPGQRGVRLSPDALDWLISQCSPDLRLLEKSLYETYQTWGTEQPITLRHVQAIQPGVR